MTTTELLVFCEQRALFAPGDALLCAVSGGADSMALLDFFFENAAVFGLSRVAACHLNHGLRGAESDADEALVRRFCEERGISFIAENARMAEASLPQGMGTEEYARELRYDFFERAAQRLACEKVATAHTATDNCETVLFRLSRGAGLRGAAGIPAKRGRYVRPLLCVTRADTERYCAEHGVPYRTDSTNLADGCARNRLRHGALPALESANSAYAQAFSDFSRIAGEADAYLRRQGEALLASAEQGGRISAAVLAGSEDILLDYALMALLARENIGYTRRMAERCRAVVRGGGRAEAAPGLLLVRRGDRLSLEPAARAAAGGEAPLAVGGRTVLPSGRGVFCEPMEPPAIYGKFIKELFSSCIDCDKVVGVPVLRGKRAGDRFSSRMRGNTKTLKKLFCEKHLTAAEREALLLVCDDEGILWLEGEGPSARAAVTEKTKNIYKLSVLKGE